VSDSSSSSLDHCIAKALRSEGQTNDVNQAYLAFLKSDLWVPVKKLAAQEKDNTQDFYPLFTQINNHYFMAAFDTVDRLKTWAGDLFPSIDVVKLSGQEVIAGINEGVYLSLNIGSSSYKEFSPEELNHLKKILSKISF